MREKYLLSLLITVQFKTEFKKEKAQQTIFCLKLIQAVIITRQFISLTLSNIRRRDNLSNGLVIMPKWDFRFYFQRGFDFTGLHCREYVIQTRFNNKTNKLVV